MKETIGLITVGLSIVAYAPYLRDLLRRKIQPHPYSWFIWGLITVIIGGLQFFNDAGAIVWSTLTVGIICFVICVLAWRAGGKRLITRQDQVSLIVALIALVLWFFANEPTFSMLLLVCVEVVGLIPTVRKTWRDPYSETLTMWTIEGFRHGLNIFAISSYSLLTLANPVVWVIIHIGFVMMVLLRRKIKVTQVELR